MYWALYYGAPLAGDNDPIRLDLWVRTFCAKRCWDCTGWAITLRE